MSGIIQVTLLFFKIIIITIVLDFNLRNYETAFIRKKN